MVGDDSVPRSPLYSRQLKAGGAVVTWVAKSVSKTRQPKLKVLQLMNKQGPELGAGEQASRSAWCGFASSGSVQNWQLMRVFLFLILR